LFFSIIFVLLASSFTFLRWSTSEEQTTSVTFTAGSGLANTGSGGGAYGKGGSGIVIIRNSR